MSNRMTELILVDINEKMEAKNRQERRNAGRALKRDLNKEEKKALQQTRSPVLSVILTAIFGSLGMLVTSIPIAILFFFLNFFLYLFAVAYLDVYGFVLVRAVNVIIAYFLAKNRNKNIENMRNKHRHNLKKLGWDIHNK